MIEALLYINIAQSAFAALIIITKRPLNTIDKILFVWLLLVSVLFAWNLVRLQISDDLVHSWVYRVVIVMTFPSFLYLYIRYLISGKSKFQRKDFWHFITFITCFIIMIVLAIKDPVSADTSNLLGYRRLFPMFLGSVFVLTFIFYGYFTIKLVNRFVKERDEYYSFHNSKVSIGWIKELVYVFYIFFGLLILTGATKQFITLHINLTVVFNLFSTLFLYTISFNGYKQSQILVIPKTENAIGNSYKKSGLKEKDAKAYETSILFLMKNEKPWLNPEVTVSDISNQLKLPQHYVTQVLNERLKKNFYTLVNEYRTNEVIRLFRKDKYKNWSLTSLAFEAGFNSRSSFNSFFKKYTGKTPSEYRKEIIAKT